MPLKHTSRLQAKLSRLADITENSRKQWWTQVRAARNDVPGPLPDRQRNSNKYKVNKAYREAANFTHLLKWKIAYVQRRSKLLERFGFTPYEMTLHDHFQDISSVREQVGPETNSHMLYGMMVQTNWRMNHAEKIVKNAEMRIAEDFKLLRDGVLKLDDELRREVKEQKMVQDAEKADRTEVKMFLDLMDEDVEVRARAESKLQDWEDEREDAEDDMEVAGRWRREVMEVMKWMDVKLRIKLRGGRQHTITEFF